MAYSSIEGRMDDMPPQALVKTLPLASPLTDRLLDEPYNIQLMRKHNIDPMLFTVVNMHLYSLCLYCGHMFFTTHKAGNNVMDNKQFFCCRECRADWNIKQALILQTLQKSQNGE